MLTWKCAHPEASRQIEEAQEPTAFSDCIRYLLIRTSMNGIAENYVPELVARAVETGLWPPDRALSVVAKIPNVAKRAKLCIALLKVAELSREQQREAQWVGWNAALAVPGWQQDNILAAPVPQLTGKQGEEVLERALEAALAEPDWQRANILAALVPQLTGPLLERALEVALAVLDERQRVETLIPFLSHIEDQGLLIQSIRQAMLDYSWSMQYLSRGEVLDRYFVKEVLIPSIFSTQTLGIIASHIIEICRQWQWL